VSGATPTNLAAIVALAALGLAAAPLPLAPPVSAVVLALATLWAPGHVLAGRLVPATTAADRVLLALVLSPWLVAAPAAALTAAGVPLAVAARCVLGLAAALAAWSWLVAEPPAPAAPAGGRAVAGLAIGWAAIVAVLFASNPHLATRSDGWFHAAVVEQIAARGLPPEDPAFAGLPLLYFWGYHLWAALWLATAPAVAVWTPLVAFNVAAAAALVRGVDAIAVRLGTAGPARGLAAGLALAGAVPGAWLIPVSRAAFGETRGVAGFAIDFEAGASSALRALAPGTLHPSLAFVGEKYLLPTPFALGLALFAAAVAWWIEAARTPRRAPLAALALIAGSALFLHTVVGFTLVLLAAVWGGWALARGDRAARGGVLGVGAALAAALLVHAPYLLAIAGAKRGQLGPGWSAPALVSMAWAGAAVVPAGLAWLWAAARSDARARDVLAIALALAVLALGLRLPENNQSKFLSLLFVLLSAPAARAYAGAFGRARPRARAAALAAGAVLLPTVALALWGFAAERGSDAEPGHHPAPAARAAWRWLAEHSDPATVVADASGASDMTVLAGRSALWGGGFVERDWGHPPAALEVRRRAARELGAGATLSPSTRDLLADLDREVVVAVRAGGGTPGAAAERVGAAPDYRRLFANDALALYAWEGPR
jgi:hypothetical protein